MLSTPTENGAATLSSLQYEHFSGFCFLCGWLNPMRLSVLQALVD